MADPHYGRALPRVLAEASVAVLRVLDRRWRRIGQCGLAVACVALVTVPALAKPPPGVTPSPWWEGAMIPGTHASCCGAADGRRVRARWLVDHWQALIDGAWRDVPPDTILRDYPPEPSGSAAVWIFDGAVICFSRPAAGG